jgi:hypothetical protein
LNGGCDGGPAAFLDVRVRGVKADFADREIAIYFNFLIIGGCHVFSFLNEASTNRLGFSMVIDPDGNFAVRFNSQINSANPNVLARTVPVSMRQQILDAISNSTGRKAYSAQ